MGTVSPTNRVCRVSCQRQEGFASQPGEKWLPTCSGYPPDFALFPDGYRGTSQCLASGRSPNSAKSAASGGGLSHEHVGVTSSLRLVQTTSARGRRRMPLRSREKAPGRFQHPSPTRQSFRHPPGFPPEIGNTIAPPPRPGLRLSSPARSCASGPAEGRPSPLSQERLWYTEERPLTSQSVSTTSWARFSRCMSTARILASHSDRGTRPPADSGLTPVP